MLDSEHKEVCIDQFMFTLTNHVCFVFLQVKKRDVMRYTGDGEPPFCMITIKHISDDTTPSDLKFDVCLGGVDKPTRLQLTRKVDSQLCKFTKDIFLFLEPNVLNVLKLVYSIHCYIVSVHVLVSL